MVKKKSMGKSSKVNENYIHKCGLVQVEIKNNVTSISNMGFTADQVIEIMNFYLLFAPILKPDNKDKSLFGLKSLLDYGWAGQQLSKLEGLLLRFSGINNFYLIKADTIDATLDEMNLGDKICIEHPRAVLKQNVKIKLLEDGSVNIDSQETRMQCLFRHIRNSIAHNHTYLFGNGNILIEDCDENKKVSARILMPKNALLKWIDIIETGPEVLKR